MKTALIIRCAALILLPLGGTIPAAIHSTTEPTEVRICWDSEPDILYQVQCCLALGSGSWMDLAGPVTGIGGSVCVTDPIGAGHCFYQVSEVGGERNAAAISATIEISAVRICWETAPGLPYQIQYASDLESSIWIDAGPPVTTTEVTTCVTEPITDLRSRYRVVGPPAMVWVPAGTFMMGSPGSEPTRGPETQHEVTISHGFWLGKYEVTQAEYLEVVGTNPSYFRTGTTNLYGGTGGPVRNEARHPVEQVSWQDATSYCALLTERERAAGRLPAGYVCRLPTEAEWEYACRAGTTTAFHYGNELRSGMANFHGDEEYPPCGGSDSFCYSPAGVNLGRTAVVGSYEPNAWGLYDMHGNVEEWVRDWWGDYPVGPVSDPTGPATGAWHVCRGGAHISGGYQCRSAYRGIGTSVSQINGFRVVAGQPAILVITFQPQDLGVLLGGDVTFMVGAEGEWPLSYHWRFNGIDISSATNSSLTIQNAQKSDEGSYSVVVTDAITSLTSDSAMLSVGSEPTITEHPESLTIRIGENATFTVAVTNSAALPIGYRWRGPNTFHEVTRSYSSSFTITNVQPIDAGAYTVVVTNGAYYRPGFLSRAARLFVLE